MVKVVNIESYLFLGSVSVLYKIAVLYTAIQKIQKYILQTIENKCALPYQAEASLKQINK